MKITSISEHIWSLRTWMVIPIHVWVVKDEDGLTLVDAGIPMMAKGIVHFIESLQAGPLRRVVLTHGHSDHVGSLKRIREVYPNVPIYVHDIEIPYMEGRQPYPRRKKAEVSLAAGIAKALPKQANGELVTIGGMTPYHTPGHSPGHVVYYHKQDRVMLAGDLFTSKKGQLRKPMAMFTANMEEAINSSAIVAELRPSRLEVCHGQSVFQPADQYEQYVSSVT